MKQLFRIALYAAIAAASCSCQKVVIEPTDDITVPEGYVLREFSASFEPGTKTVRDEDGKTVWVLNDRIRVFWDTGYTSAELFSGEGSQNAVFRAVIPDGKTVEYALYPEDVNKDLNLAIEEIEVEIGSEQNGSFSQANIAVAKVNSSNTFVFFNVNALLCFEIPGEDITKVTVESVDGSALVGRQVVSFAGSSPSLGGRSDTQSSVTMGISGSGKYYISVLAGVQHAKGLLIKYYKGDDVSGTYYLDKDFTPQRSKVYAFGAFQPNGHYYASVDGGGKRSGWNSDNAMRKDQLLALLTFPTDDGDRLAAKKASLAGATIHLAAGAYNFGQALSLITAPAFDPPITLYIMGNSSEDTFISGDGSYNLVELGPGINVTFIRISFSGANITAADGTVASFTDCGFKFYPGLVYNPDEASITINHDTMGDENMKEGDTMGQDVGGTINDNNWNTSWHQ